MVSIYKIMNNDEYYNCVKDLMDNNVIKKMDEFIQHGTTTTLEHCLTVSYHSYKIAKFLKLDYKSAARAGLLHDLFLYDWHIETKGGKFFEQHGFVHPQIALDNANKYFILNEKEKDIIKKHMWPLTLTKVPKYRESFLVSFVDKYLSCSETIPNLLEKFSKYLMG